VVEHVSAVQRDQDRKLSEITIDSDELARAQPLGRLNALPSARAIGAAHFASLMGVSDICIFVESGVSRAVQAAIIGSAQGSIPMHARHAEWSSHISGSESETP